MGYGSTVYVTLEDPRPDLTIELCDGDGCIPGPVEMPVQIGATEQPLDTGILSLEGDSAKGWTAGLVVGQPVLGYRITDSTGAIVAQGQAQVAWVRVDGTEECGGNTEARVELAT